MLQEPRADFSMLSNQHSTLTTTGLLVQCFCVSPRIVTEPLCSAHATLRYYTDALAAELSACAVRGHRGAPVIRGERGGLHQQPGLGVIANLIPQKRLGPEGFGLPMVSAACACVHACLLAP